MNRKYQARGRYVWKKRSPLLGLVKQEMHVLALLVRSALLCSALLPGLWDYAVLFFGRLDIDPDYRCDIGGMCKAAAAAIVPFEIWGKVLQMLKVMPSPTQ